MKNKRILVTGGTTGIGLATAQLLAAEGAQVVVTGRNPETLATAQKELPPGVVVLKSDSGSLDDATGLGAVLQSHLPAVDAVFLNAGVGQFGPIEAMTPKHFDDMFNINVRGLYFQLQSLLPLLRNPSSVVLNASIAAFLALPGASLYSATKAAVSSLGRTLAVELAPRGVRLNTISPGPITTPIYSKLGMPLDAQKAFEEQMAGSSLLKRFGTSAEVAKLVRFLLSDDSSYITGEEIVIDGGVQLT